MKPPKNIDVVPGDVGTIGVGLKTQIFLVNNACPSIRYTHAHTINCLGMLVRLSTRAFFATGADAHRIKRLNATMKLDLNATCLIVILNE